MTLQQSWPRGWWVLGEVSLRRSLLWGVLSILVPLVWAEVAPGQADEDRPAPQKALAVPARPPVKAPAKAPPPSRKDSDQPKPEELTGSELRTADGVGLCATFYPSTQGKKAVPVILLHGYQEDRSVFLPLAELLQKQGHAVLVPDLRGHGDSKEQRLGFSTRTIDAAKMGNEQFGRMVTHDLEALKKCLLEKNNSGKLNLEKLCVVGSGMGALVAMNWAVLDWSWPIYPGLKQGQYVKALVLLSPPRSFRGLNVKPALEDPKVRGLLSIYLIAGRENAKGFEEVQRLHTALERFHPEPAKEQTDSKKDLFIKGLETNLQGSRLLGSRGFITEGLIAKFIELRLVKQDFPWQESGKKAAQSR
jgi:pimeloyl-ACP methyl ester carboxylesterase